MIKKIFHKSFSILLAFLVLLSTVSFTVEKHYCGDVLIDTAVFSELQGCGMEMSSTDKKQCCKDEFEVVKGQDKLKITSFDDLKFDQQVFISNYVYSYSNLFIDLPKQIIPHKNYSPPNLVADIQVLDQVFII